MKTQVFIESFNRLHGTSPVRIIQTITLCATILLLAGCSKDSEQQPDVPPSYKLEIG